jgi:hypothetical protein
MFKMTRRYSDALILELGEPSGLCAATIDSKQVRNTRRCRHPGCLISITLNSPSTNRYSGASRFDAGGRLTMLHASSASPR